MYACFGEGSTPGMRGGPRVTPYFPAGFVGQTRGGSFFRFALLVH